MWSHLRRGTTGCREKSSSLARAITAEMGRRRLTVTEGKSQSPRSVIEHRWPNSAAMRRRCISAFNEMAGPSSITRPTDATPSNNDWRPADIPYRRHSRHRALQSRLHRHVPRGDRGPSMPQDDPRSPSIFLPAFHVDPDPVLRLASGPDRHLWIAESRALLWRRHRLRGTGFVSSTLAFQPHLIEAVGSRLLLLTGSADRPYFAPSPAIFAQGNLRAPRTHRRIGRQDRAAAMAALAALRSGTGLVTAAVPSASMISWEAKLLEAMTPLMPETKARTFARSGSIDCSPSWIRGMPSRSARLTTHPENRGTRQEFVRNASTNPCVLMPTHPMPSREKRPDGMPSPADHHSHPWRNGQVGS